jgi:trigger factor
MCGAGLTARHGIVARVAAVLKTTVTELAGSRVRLGVEVAADELTRRLEQRARQLGRELKLPGFRRGKVPPALVIQRVGRDALLSEAVRDGVSKWYSDAIDDAHIVPVGDPELDLGELPPDGEPLRFTIEVGVLPKAQLGGWEGLEAPRREPEVPEQDVEREVEAVRDRLARLQTAERPAALGDFVVVDYHGWRLQEGPDGEPRRTPLPGGEGRDRLVELGAGNLLPGFEEGLLGALAKDTRTVGVTFPEDYPEPELAGAEGELEVTVKEVKVKQLPELDEDLAFDAGFDGLDELREDIRERLREAEAAQIEGEFREAALDAVVARARVELTPELIRARAKEMWERVLRSLAQRGVSREAYLGVAGRSEQELLAEMETEAERALRREAVLTAIVAQEAIEVGDEELLEAVLPEGEELEDGAHEGLLAELRSSGRIEELRERLAASRAVELAASRVAPISVAQAQARERLWTPEREASSEPAAAGAPGRLWTPAEPRAAS